MTFIATTGIALQANETGVVPTVAQILPFLPKDKTLLFTLRDTLGWHEVEKVKDQIVLTPTWLGLGVLVQQLRALGYNVQLIATLYGGNELYGLKPAAMPTMATQIAAFAAYAVWVAKSVPNLFAVSIWNEMDGQTNGGITNVDAQHVALANLTMNTIPAVRAANSAVKIIAGATTGDNIDGFVINTSKCGLDFTKADYLDAHPYISTAKGAVSWFKQMANIRKAGIVIPLWFTEWGGPCPGNYGAGYVKWFLANIVGGDAVPVAGGNFFTLQDSAKFPMAGLVDAGGALTAIGDDYIAAFAA